MQREGWAGVKRRVESNKEVLGRTGGEERRSNHGAPSEVVGWHGW